MGLSIMGRITTLRGLFWSLMALTVGTGVSAQSLAPGETFQDCKDCPPMVVVAAGSFVMGDDASDRLDERPAHQVTVRAFAAGRTEVTHAQYAVFAKETGRGATGPCTTDVDRDGRWGSVADASWVDPKFPIGDASPVTCINWSDAKAYAHWLAEKTGKPYRLLSEAEYEYALRAGTKTQFWWGNDPDQMCRYANGHDQRTNKLVTSWTGGAACDDGHDVLAPVASYPPNAFGLYDLAGNAWEWTADCYAPTYQAQPRDGSPLAREGCNWVSTRGGSWAKGMSDLRSAQRNWKIQPGQRGADVGFRVARDL